MTTPRPTPLSRWRAPEPAGGGALVAPSAPGDGLAPAYEFRGRHLLVSYGACDAQVMRDTDGMRDGMRRAVEASGATILDEFFHVFPPHGLTALYLLSESHASLHTYPEHRACFVDLFTCGSHCSAERFERALREHFRPHVYSRRVFVRHIDARDDAMQEVR